VVADRHVGEVNDEVGPLGQAQQQPVAVADGEVEMDRLDYTRSSPRSQLKMLGPVRAEVSVGVGDGRPAR
jgi:hypothetical protein